MDAGEESPLWKKIIPGLVGMLGVALLMQGAVMATDASTDMTGTILIIVGLLLSFGCWRLWPASASNNTHNSTEQHLQISEPSMVETNAEEVFPLQDSITLDDDCSCHWACPLACRFNR